MSEEKVVTGFDLNIMHNQVPCGYHESVLNLTYTIGL